MALVPCPNCGNSVSSAAYVCPKCNQVLQSQPSVTVPDSISKRVSALSKRYKDAYLVAKVTVGIGSTIKVIGFILAALIFFISLFLSSTASKQSGGFGSSEDVSSGVSFVIIASGTSFAFVIGFVSYIFGVIVSAQGQVLKASLDNTVGNSPFLTSDLKARIMSLPEA